MRELGFYQGHLDRVSRSFAFCIRRLDPPLRAWVSLSYLLCRVLDTVEDSAWDSLGSRAAQYDRFERFASALPRPEEVRDWAARFPSSIPESERALLDDAYPLFEDLHGLPSQVRSDIQVTLFRMSGGMRHHSTLQDGSGQLKLLDLASVNRYCYFVAGVVGELLTRLLQSHRPQFSLHRDLMKNAFHFGLFLQKVNLLKDQRADEAEGRFLVPDRRLVLASLRQNARGSLLYLTSLPKEEKGYRVFCAWSLFLGLASLPWIQQDFSEGNGAKIPRAATEALLAEIEEIVQDDALLLARGEECVALLPEHPVRAGVDSLQAREEEAWFHRISGGVLGSTELHELGIC